MMGWPSKKTILVMSGKGGVGKSSVAVNLAAWLHIQGLKTGLLDIDIHGPSVPHLLGLQKQRLSQMDNKLLPVDYADGLKVMSIGFMLNDDTTPVIWRGPAKHSIIEQFVQQSFWSELDYLIIDCPPGTGDETLSAVQLLDKPDGVVIVTTPQDIAVLDVKKCLSFCRELQVPVLGIIENMSGMLCPHCNKRIDVFSQGGGQLLSDLFDVPFLGGIPMDPNVAGLADAGRPITQYMPESPTAQAMAQTFKTILES
jgi:Mrp family chromosome partitioning ATPase